MKFQEPSENLAVAGSPPEINAYCMFQCNETAFNKVKGDKKTYLWDGMGSSLISYVLFSSGSSFSGILPPGCKNNKKTVNILAKENISPTQNILPKNKILKKRYERYIKENLFESSGFTNCVSAFKGKNYEVSLVDFSFCL